MMAYGMWHVASARPASADVILIFFILFFYLSFLNLLPLCLLFLFFCKFCIKGVYVRVYMCVYVIIMDIISCTVPSLGEGSVERMRGRRSVCMYLPFVRCIFNLFKRGGIKIKRRGLSLFSGSCWIGC